MEKRFSINALHLAAAKAREVMATVKHWADPVRIAKPTPNWIVGCVKQLDTFYASKPIDLINVDGNGIQISSLHVAYPDFD